MPNLKFSPAYGYEKMGNQYMKDWQSNWLSKTKKDWQSNGHPSYICTFLQNDPKLVVKYGFEKAK